MAVATARPTGSVPGSDSGRAALAPVPAPLSRWRLAAALVALALSGAAQWYIAFYRPEWPLVDVAVANIALVVGAVALAALIGTPDPLPLEGVRVAAATPWGWSERLGTLATLCGFGIVFYAAYVLFSRWAPSFTSDAPLMVAGVAVASAGLWSIDRAQQSTAPRLRMPWWELVLFVGVLVLGTVLRFYRYDYFPPPDGFCAIEETQTGAGAFAIMRDGLRPWEFLGDRWMVVPFFKALGVTITAVRLPYTMVSALTLIPLYLMLRYLVARPAALFATFLFAVSRWHLIYARSAHNIFPTTLIVMIVLYLCVRAYRRGGLALYPWIGFLTAYTLYTYAGYRGTTILVGVFFAIALVERIWALRTATGAEARIAARRQLALQAAGLTLALLAYVAVVIPLISQLRYFPQYYFEAANRSLVNKDYYTTDPHAFIALRIERLTATAKIFNHQGDDSPAFNLPGVPMLDPLSGLLLTLGLAYCLIWARHRMQGFFAFAFLLLLILGTTFTQNLAVCRLQGIIPLLFVLIAFFVDRLASAVTARWRRVTRPLLAAVALAAAAFAFHDNYSFFFGRFITNKIVRSTFTNPYTISIDYLHQLPSDAYMLMLTDTFDFFMSGEYSWWRGDRVPGNTTADLLPVLNGGAGPWAGRDLRVIIEEPYDREEMVALLRTIRPDAKCEVVIPPDRPDLLYNACQVPQTPARLRFQGGVRARYFRGHDAQPILERTEPAISYGLMPDACHYPSTVGQPPCRAEWEGTLEVPQSGRYTFAAEARQGDISFTVDGQHVGPDVALTAGPHVITVAAQFRSLENLGARLRWKSGGAAWRPVQFATVVPADTPS